METSFLVSISFRFTIHNDERLCYDGFIGGKGSPRHERQEDMGNGRYRTVDEMADYFARLSAKLEVSHNMARC